MPGPQDLIAQLLAQQGAGGAPGVPGSPGMPMPMPGGASPMPPMDPSGAPPPGTMPPTLPPDMPEGEPTDEAMLENVSNEMGGGSPPPTGGMKWVSLEEDQEALLRDPSPENVQAFTQYWGEDKLPEELQGEAASEAGPEDVPEMGD